MIRGLYTSAAGMIVTQKQSDTIAENMFNVRNPGFRQEQRAVQAFPTVLVDRIEGNGAGAVSLGAMGTGVVADKISVKTAPGLVQSTDQATDVALISPGFFVAQTVAGERLTRNGHFRMDPDGRLRTSGGNLVLGENGPIGPLSENFKVELDGTIKDNGKIIDRLRIVDVPGTALKREGKTTLYAYSELPTSVDRETIRIKQGAVEESNVDVDNQMVQMITVTRAYEANQKVIQTLDNTLEKAVNEVGKV